MSFVECRQNLMYISLTFQRFKWEKGNSCVLFINATTYNFYFRYNRLHTGNIFSCSECLKLQKFAFHFRSPFLYTELPSSVYEFGKLQFFAGKWASSLYSMSFSFNFSFTMSTVSWSGNGVRYAT